MPKGNNSYKIKRYSSLYPKRRSPAAVVLRTVVTVAVVCALGFIGWNAYGPVMDYFSGALAASARLRQEAESSSSSQAPEPASSEEEEAVKEPEMPQEIRGIYLPPSVVGSEAGLNAALAKLENTEINAVLFDLKDGSGKLQYFSGQSLIDSEKVEAPSPVDLNALCAKLEEKNLIPMGRMYAFSDPIAASKIPDAGIKYMSTEMLWLDNSQENNGKAWLNPYSTAAQNYLTELAAEATTLGVRRILWEGVNFPTGYGQEFANFGPNAAASNKAATLRSFLELVTNRVESLGGECALYVTGPAALGGSDTYFGGNPLDIAGDHVALGAMPLLFGDQYSSPEFSVAQPVLNPYATVHSLFGALSPRLSGKTVTALVQGYTATGSLVNNKVYTADDMKEQLRALADSGVTNYILYSPGGNYPTAG